MKHRSTQFSTLSTFSTFSKRASRRRFLSSALLAVAALAARPAFARSSDPERERLTCLLARYGSELADLKRVEGRE